MAYQKPKGTQDIFENTHKWVYVETVARSLCDYFDYKEIRTPIFEQLELFKRAVGDETDVVSKEMYNFTDKGGREIALRPENTAGVVRSYIENKLYALPNQPVKMFYFGPQFRYERPQEGRQRQFHQFGVEAIGEKSPRIDAEQIILAYTFLMTLGIDNLVVSINSLGDQKSRSEYRVALKNHLVKFEDQLCDDCKKRINTNVLRVLDCKVCADKESHTTAPILLDYINDESKKYFETVKNILSSGDIKCEINPRLVRGLDYYNDTVFEIATTKSSLKSQGTICGGGRYDGLVKQLGGPEVSGVGFAMGVERIMNILEEMKKELVEPTPVDVTLIGLSESAKDFLVLVNSVLAQNGIKTIMDYKSTNIKKQFELASRRNSKLTIIVGDEELTKGEIKIKSQITKEEITITLDKIIDQVDRMLGE